MTNRELNDKYKRLKAAGMSRVEGLAFDSIPLDHFGLGCVACPSDGAVLSDQHAEDLITMQAMRHFKVLFFVDRVNSGRGKDSGERFYCEIRENYGQGDSIIEAILDAVEAVKQ